MNDFQIFLLGLQKMPWLIVIPIALAWTGLVEAVDQKWERRFGSDKEFEEAYQWDNP